MRKERTNKINVYKVSKNNKFNKLDFDGLNYFEKEYEDDNTKLFIRRKKEGTPYWLDFIKPLISSNIKKIKNSNSSFIFVKKHNSGIYILTGGYCYSLIEKYIENDFGVEIALRLINESNIKAINQRSLKGNTRQIFRSVVGYDPIFDKENINRVLNAIVGKGEFEGKSFQINGRSSLSIRTTKDINRINEVLDEIAEKGTEPEKVHFPKSYEIENKENVLKELNEEMLGMINNYFKGTSGRDRLFLELKDPLSQLRSTDFIIKYRGNKFELEDFDLDIIKREFVEKDILSFTSLDDFKKIKIYGIDEDGFEQFNNDFKEMIVCEIEKDGKYYIKIGNNWLRILNEFQKVIDENIISIKLYKGLPDWDKKICKIENDYNKFVANRNNWKCLDGKLISIKGYSGGIEVCDIYNKEDNTFFHIKNTWGSKSAYLFTQGTTSAELMSNSDEFRNNCKKKWPDEFDGTLVDSKVVFGIATEKDIKEEFPKNMTFFAKLNLFEAVNILRINGYDTMLALIKIIN